MTYWTEKMNPSKRVWQCFVCGEKHEDYSTYAEHIVKEHEEGREYIVCPVDICKAPVRDLKVHFKTKHPNRVMPKNCQTKAIIWKDFSLTGKVKTRKPSFKEGWFESKKNNGAKLFYRSGYEAEVYKCLEEDKEIRSFEAEPFKIPYFFEKGWHNYKPDIKVTFQTGGIEIWEIKPKSQKGIKKNQAKWQAMNEYANNLGWSFVVITEKEIKDYKQKIINQKNEANSNQQQ